MRLPFSFRSLLAICLALVILLATLAAVQYRWATRVAAADAQREREHLETSAALFASQFNDAVLQTLGFMQKDAQEAMKSGQPASAPPKIIGELYYLDVSDKGTEEAKRLNPQGVFETVPVPDWFQPAHCRAVVLDRPPAVVLPIFQIQSVDKASVATLRIVSNFHGGRCFIAKLDERYLRDELFPKLVRQSFGETSANDYDFAVIPRERPAAPLYGKVLQADLQKPFFPMALRSPEPPPPTRSGQAPRQMFFQRFEYNVIGTTAPGGFAFRDGIWELDVAHKGVPLAVSFEQTRRRNLLFSLAVEALLIAAIVFLVVGVRRMQWLAEQKMQFVAAVSHELRAPVSAISMLSRNQADGLVTGQDKVQQYGELMHQQSRRLNEMVEQTLQYAGIHSNLGRPTRTEVSLKRLIHEAVEARRPDLTRHGFQIEIDAADGLPAVYGDEKLLRIAIDNLLSNAEKYADGGRWIRVSSSYSPSEKEVRISVEDQGPGIAAEDQAQIFEPFCRGQAAIDAQIPGSGIGLSLVRSAAEAHRGTVTLVSEPGHGSTFTLHLPV